LKKVLVTGAGGFIGSNTIEYLEQKKYDILSPSSKELNLFDYDAVKNYIKNHNPNYLLHLAWHVTPGQYLHNNNNYDWLEASKNLLYCFKENNGFRAVVAGTCFEDFYDYPYPACKKALLEILEKLEISYAWGKIYYLFGENEHADRLVPSLINSILSKKEIQCSSGEQARDYMYVKDAARAFVEILDSDIQGVVDIGTGEAIPVKTIINLIAEKLNGHEYIKFGKIDRSENEINTIVANISRLKDELFFVQEFSMREGLQRILNNVLKDVNDN